MFKDKAGNFSPLKLIFAEAFSFPYSLTSLFSF